MTLIAPSKKPIKKVGIISKSAIGEQLSILKNVVRVIKKNKKEILMCEHSAPLITGYEGFPKEDLFKECDLIVVLGGDGTILKSAACTGKKVVPLLSVNVGTLGFLSEVKPDDFENAFNQVIKHKYILDKRSMLRVTKYRGKTKLRTFLAMNDAVINQGLFARLIELNIEIDEKKVVTFKADGMIMATPTGSTAHSLSAGGPIVHPDLDAMVLTPICPSTLSLRPIVVPSNRQVKVTIVTKRRGDYNLGLTLDGQITVPLEYGDQINIRKSSRSLYMVRLSDGDYYKLLRDKLGWGYHAPTS